MVIAQEKGFFAAQGVEVDAIYSEDTTAQMADLGAEKIDGAALALGSIVNINGKNPNIHIIFATDQSVGADAIVADAEIQRVSDLKGKRIGTGLGGFGELFVITMLEKYGLTSDDVRIVQVDGQNVPTRLKKQDIQAGQTWEPYVSEAVKAGGRVLFSSREVPGLIPDVMAFRDSVLRDRRQDVQAFVRAWFQAVDYWEAHPQAASALIAQKTKLPLAAISLTGINLMTQAENAQAFIPGQSTDSLHYTAKRYSDFYVQTGGISRALDIPTLLDASFLPHF
jgi:NitT/TauT family transport system substrate-binding protein